MSDNRISIIDYTVYHAGFENSLGHGGLSPVVLVMLENIRHSGEESATFGERKASR